MEIPVKTFKEAIAALNSFLPKGEKIKTLKVKKEEILKAFEDVVMEKIADGTAGDLPEKVIDMFNQYLSTTEEAEEAEEADEEAVVDTAEEAEEAEPVVEETPEKTGKKKPAKTGKKLSTKKSDTKKPDTKKLGTKKPAGKTGKAPEKKTTKPAKIAGEYSVPADGTQAFAIDALLKKGSTVEDIAKKVDVKIGRVNLRIKSLIARGFSVVEKDGKYTLTV